MMLASLSRLDEFGISKGVPLPPAVACPLCVLVDKEVDNAESREVIVDSELGPS